MDYQVFEQLLRYLEEGNAADCIFMLDDLTDVVMHQHVLAVNAPFLHILVTNHGVWIHNKIYMRLHNISRANFLMIRKFIYTGHAIVAELAMLPLLEDGMQLGVFDSEVMNRFGNCPNADYYLLHLGDPSTMYPPGTSFIEDNIEWVVIPYGEPLERDMVIGANVLVEDVPEHSEWYNALDIPQGYDEAALLEHNHSDHSDDDVYETASDEIDICAFPSEVFSGPGPFIVMADANDAVDEVMDWDSDDE